MTTGYWCPYCRTLIGWSTKKKKLWPHKCDPVRLLLMLPFRWLPPPKGHR